MQIKKKQNTKPVGAGFHTRPKEGMTRNNGITLIALIITIIVMLILVGVTINVALNGGLFTKASEASKQMQVEADRETLLSAVVAAIGYDGKVDLEDIELPTGWTGANGTYTSQKGNTFTVTEDGKITEDSSETGENENTKMPLAQIKNGDVWNDVTFYATTISNQGITIPTTGIKAVRDENGNYVPEKDVEGNNIPVQFDNTPYVFYIFFGGLEAGIGYGPTGSGYRIMFGNDYAAGFNTIDSNEVPLEDGVIYKMQDNNLEAENENKITTNDLENISFSGTITAVAMGNADGKIVSAIVPIDQDFRYWFTGDVTYVEDDIYFE